MAKASKKKADFDVEVLKGIASGTVKFVGAAEGKPLLDAGLIVVDNSAADPNDANKRAVAVSEAGVAWLNANVSKSVDAPAKSAFAIITGAVPPPSKRGAGLRGSRNNGTPKYPFNDLPLGGSFFVPVSEDTPEPLKSLGSAISAANMRYAEDTGTTKQAMRAAKGPDGKARKTADGKLVKEEVAVPVYKFTRKFQIRGVEKGKVYGNWTADSDGALITRIEPTA